MVLRLLTTLQQQQHRCRPIALEFRRCMSSKDAVPTGISGITINNPKELYKEGECQPDKEDGLNQVEIYARKMRMVDPNLVYASTLLPDPVPDLPENLAEIASLDEAMTTWKDAQIFDQPTPGGRVVTIRQCSSRSSQAPKGNEMFWKISFEDDGETAQKWKNPLMGWKSSADPMHGMSMQMVFDSAKEATNFAKMRGWNFVVVEPRLRMMRSDGVTYQDNFLPKFVAAKVMRDGIKCDHWSRPKAGASHYFRPLKYHGDGLVSQFGPNPDAPVAPECQAYYKLR